MQLRLTLGEPKGMESLQIRLAPQNLLGIREPLLTGRPIFAKMKKEIFCIKVANLN
jgi:hypothetical protein